MLAGAGVQGFTEWQSANMFNRTNMLVTDIFTALLKYKCGLPQGSGFSVEIANLYAMLLLLWWNMDPINPTGTIAPFTSPRHGFPLIAGGILKPVASLAYVDDAKRYVAMAKTTHSLPEFFRTVQGYCDLLADLSLVIKMGRNVRKCTIYLYNIPDNAIIPTFHSIAWSYDSQGPVKGTIATVVMQRDPDGHLLCYDIPKTLRTSAPQNTQSILIQRKYLGVSTNAQLDGTEGKEKILNKLAQRVGLTSKKADSVQETKLGHNMLVNQVATFSPICISMSLAECTNIDKQLLKAYQYRLQYMSTDAKHNIFMSPRIGGIGVKSFTREYVGGLLRDIEVHITNTDSLPAHALVASIEAATTQRLFNLHQAGLIPVNTNAATRAEQISISAKKTMTYFGDMDSPIATSISFDHTHTMERAITTTCALGFMLRDMHNEFAARFADELLLLDKRAKTLGCHLLPTRASLGAYIGEGCKHFEKYSLLGRVYLLIQTATEEANNHVLTRGEEIKTSAVESLLSRPLMYDGLKLFPGEISALKLASSARSCIQKFKEDYKICGFHNLVEWRCCEDCMTNESLQKPASNEYRIIISDRNAFQPSILVSMETNSNLLSDHLRSTLSLTKETDNLSAGSTNERHPMTDTMILEYATQHDLPIFISIDGSVSNDGTPTVSLSILAPDIRQYDTSQEWENRLAKVLLIRSWKLPRQWGTGSSCINMAESFGFILGEYTIPADQPVIYITDSNNARTLQRNLKNSSSFTHRKLVRTVKQGIDYSIANHLEHLTSKWPREDQETTQAKQTYQQGVDTCKRWSTQQPLQKTVAADDKSQHSLTSWDDRSDSSSESNASTGLNPLEKKNRYYFDASMYDNLGRITVIKVFSHQLNTDCTIKIPNKHPRPNLFVVSANQFADNAATQARLLSRTLASNIDTLSYPAFSPRWCFSFEGKITNKGATKVLQERMDLELLLRQQLRKKQGLFNRLASFSGLRMEQIGDESLLRNMIKFTAPCWTRCIYRHPPIVHQIWEYWRNRQSATDRENIPIDIPKNWKDIPLIRDHLIKACPFCGSFGVEGNKIGNLEHLHLYCPNIYLQKARDLGNQNLEKAIYDVYNFAAKIQYNCSQENTTRTTALQEIMEQVARETELQERPVARSSELSYETRTSNKAILSKTAIQIKTLLGQLPASKLAEYDTYPLTAKLGFIIFMPEAEYDVASATITDVGFLGIFPKPILGELRRYARELKNLNQDYEAFLVLTNTLVDALIYRGATVQKVIHILLAKIKATLQPFGKKRKPSSPSS